MLGGDGGNAPDVIGAEAFRPDIGEMPLKPPINLPKLPETRRKFAIFLLWMERATGIELNNKSAIYDRFFRYFGKVTQF